MDEVVLMVWRGVLAILVGLADYMTFLPIRS